MPALPAIAIFDIGKTNKKLFLLDEQYQIVYETCEQLAETVDEEGDACENLQYLHDFIFEYLHKAENNKAYFIKAINFSAYGASFVYINKEGQPIAPLYNYLKPYPQDLQKEFYNDNGGVDTFSYKTASPALGSLNSGLQLYRIKHQKPDIYNKIAYALHLPQYVSYLITKTPCSDLTSIGCHTALWDFEKNHYHDWLKKEGVAEKLASIVPCDKTLPAVVNNHPVIAGIGLHDSSAALVPYLLYFHNPFILLSTGSWCISLHPFNQQPLTLQELQKDCLCYLTYKGQPVKASRLFAGNEHEQQVKRIAAYFQQPTDRYRKMSFNPHILKQLPQADGLNSYRDMDFLKESRFSSKDLAQFTSDEEAYHQLLLDLVLQQVASTQLLLKNAPVKQLYVDGGFSQNEIYMHLLACFFPQMEVYAASVPQATAIGAALCIHKDWNPLPLPQNLITLKHYPAFTLHCTT